jgi:ribosomal protein S18 acetylase RimI-like enzyme
MQGLRKTGEKLSIEEYITIAEKTGVFKASEIKVLREILDDTFRYQEQNYFLIDEKKDDIIIGFVIFGKNSLTEFTWDIYWLVVDPDFERQGIGGRLLDRIVLFTQCRHSRFILRVETSSSGKYRRARCFYTRKGFIPAGRIPDFYAVNDDLLVYYLQYPFPNKRNT